MQPICFEVVPDDTRSVESRDCAARDRDEQEWEHRRRADGCGVHGRGLDGRIQYHQAECEQREAGNELVGVQVIAGLQQQPDRQHRCDQRVEQQDPDPGGDGDLADGGE